MGKHDKQDINFSWNPMPDEFYKARISTLEKVHHLVFGINVCSLIGNLVKEALAARSECRHTDGCINEYMFDGFHTKIHVLVIDTNELDAQSDSQCELL